MTPTDEALALAEAERAFERCAGTPYGHSVHVTDETRTIVRRALREMREGNAALRDLAGAQERAEKAEERVRELEALIAVMDAHTPRADETCAEPGITFSEACRRYLRDQAALGEGGHE